MLLKQTLWFLIIISKRLLTKTHICVDFCWRTLKPDFSFLSSLYKDKCARDSMTSPQFFHCNKYFINKQNLSLFIFSCNFYRRETIRPLLEKKKIHPISKFCQPVAKLKFKSPPFNHHTFLRTLSMEIKFLTLLKCPCDVFNMLQAISLAK